MSARFAAQRVDSPAAKISRNAGKQATNMLDRTLIISVFVVASCGFHWAIASRSPVSATTVECRLRSSSSVLTGQQDTTRGMTLIRDRENSSNPNENIA